MPLVILCFWIGLYPKPVFDVLEKPVNYVVSKVDHRFVDAEVLAEALVPTAPNQDSTEANHPTEEHSN